MRQSSEALPQEMTELKIALTIRLFVLLYTKYMAAEQKPAEKVANTEILRKHIKTAPTSLVIKSSWRHIMTAEVASRRPPAPFYSHSLVASFTISYTIHFVRFVTIACYVE